MTTTTTRPHQPIPLLVPIRSRRKLEAAQKALRELAFSLGANNKLPTVREICRAMKISAVTAENVLSGLEEQCVVIRRPGSGIYVSPRLYQKNVGLVFGRHAFQPGTSPFCAMIVEGCQRRAQNHNERFSFYLDVPRGGQAPDMESEGGDGITKPGGGGGGPVHADLIEALSRGRLDGILLVARHSVEQEAWLRSQGLPVVSFSGGVVSPFVPNTVGFDLQEMMRLAASELAARGCRRIAFISPSSAGTSTFAPELSRFSLPADERWVVAPTTTAAPNATRDQLGRQAWCQIAAAANSSGGGKVAMPDGLIVMDDMLATGALAAAHESGLILGRDLIVASHANAGSSTLDPYHDRIIRIQVDPNEIVESMFGMLEIRMINARPPHAGAGATDSGVDTATATSALLVSVRVCVGSAVLPPKDPETGTGAA